MSTWKNRHPGGKSVIEAGIGTDCTDKFISMHPPYAYSYLQSVKKVGYLKDQGPNDPVSEDYRKLHEELTKEGAFEPTMKMQAIYLSRIIFFIASSFILMYKVNLIAARIVGAVCMGMFW